MKVLDYGQVCMHVFVLTELLRLIRLAKPSENDGDDTIAGAAVARPSW